MSEILLEKIFIGLSNKHRLCILNLLKDGTKSVDEIANNIALSKATISYHLKVLRTAGLINARKQKNYVFYALNSECIDKLYKWFQVFMEKGDVYE